MDFAPFMHGISVGHALVYRWLSVVLLLVNRMYARVYSGVKGTPKGG